MEERNKYVLINIIIYKYVLINIKEKYFRKLFLLFLSRFCFIRMKVLVF